MNTSNVDWSFYFGVAGFILSSIGVVIAIIQTIRYRNVSEKNKELRRNRYLQIWSNINSSIIAFDKLDKVQDSLKGVSGLDESIPRRISNARQGVVSLWMQLIKDAAAEEEEFTEETVEEWYRLNKLGNEWRRDYAMQLVGPNLNYKF